MPKPISTTLRNPLTEDPTIKKLLDEITDIPNELQFKRWKEEFLTQFDKYLDPVATNNANRAFREFSDAVISLAQDVRRMEVFRENGDMTEDRCSVQARRCLGNFSSKINRSTIMMDQLMPPTQEAEREAGFTKFNLGAILVRDGFVEYDRLEKIKIHLNDLRRSGLDIVADSLTLSAIDKYGAAFDQLLDILADLGLSEVMEQCTSFIKGEWAPPSPVNRRKSLDDLSELQEALRQPEEEPIISPLADEVKAEMTSDESSDSSDSSVDSVKEESHKSANLSPTKSKPLPPRQLTRSKSAGPSSRCRDDAMKRSSSGTFEFSLNIPDDWKGFRGSNTAKKEEEESKRQQPNNRRARSKSVGPPPRRQPSRTNSPHTQSPARAKTPLRIRSMDKALPPSHTIRKSSFSSRSSAGSRGGKKCSNTDGPTEISRAIPVPPDHTRSKNGTPSSTNASVEQTKQKTEAKSQQYNRKDSQTKGKTSDTQKTQGDQAAVPSNKTRRADQVQQTTKLVNPNTDPSERQLDKPSTTIKRKDEPVISPPLGSARSLTPVPKSNRSKEDEKKPKSGLNKSNDDRKRHATSEDRTPSNSQRRRPPSISNQRSTSSSRNDSPKLQGNPNDASAIRPLRSQTPARKSRSSSEAARVSSNQSIQSLPSLQETKRSQTPSPKQRSQSSLDNKQNQTKALAPLKESKKSSPAPKAAVPSKKSDKLSPVPKHNEKQQASHPPSSKSSSQSSPASKDKRRSETPARGAATRDKTKPQSPKKNDANDKTKYCPCCGQKWPLWKRILGNTSK